MAKYVAWMVLLAGSGLCGAQSPPDSMPCVLLSSPIKAAWAAQHVSDWVDKGLKGFILQGLMDDVYADIETLDQPNTGADEERFSVQFAAAVRRLSEAGLDRNFLRVGFAIDRPYFSEPALWDYVADRFAAAGRFCKGTGLRGIAIDSQAGSLFNDYRWDGYRYEQYTPEDVQYGAMEFGLKAVSAYLQAFPDADILVFADDWPGPGPLWLPMFEGMVEAVGQHPEASIQLLLKKSLQETDLQALRQLPGHMERLLKVRFGERNRRTWLDRGGIGLGLAPLERAKGSGAVAARYPLESYRQLLAGALLLSRRYAWVNDGGACWWRVPDGEQEAYSRIPQGAATLPANVGQAAEELDIGAYSARSPFGALERAGEYLVGASPAYILHSATGAAALLWQGSTETLILEHRETPAAFTDIATGVKTHVPPQEGVVTLGPFSHATLIENLSARDLVLPASMWLEADLSPSSGRNSTPLSFGFANHTGFALEGSLSALAPVHMAVEPDILSLSTLQPGEEVHARGALQGAAKAGSAPAVRLSLALPGSAPYTRSFSLPVLPSLRWSTRTLGPVSAAPIVATLESDGPARVIACGESGEVVCLDEQGNLCWRRLLSGRFDQAAAVGSYWTGGRCIATVDERGHVRVLKPDGEAAWDTTLGCSVSASGLQYAELHRFPGDELVGGLTDGRVVALIANGFPFWLYETGGHHALVATGDVSADGLAEVFVATDSGELLGLTHDGRLRWKAALDGGATCTPVLADWDGDGRAEVATGTDRGALQVWDSDTGQVKAARRIADTPRIRGLGVGKLQAGKGPAFLVSSGSSLCCLGTDFRALWTQPIACGGNPVVASQAGNAMILVSTISGELVCLDGAGQVAWRDTRAAAALCATPTIASLNGTSASCLYTSRDGFIRASAVE